MRHSRRGRMYFYLKLNFKMENLYTPNSIRLFSGKYFNPLEPDIDLIDIQDIAHGLSMQCRFGGHTSVFYSVAEHCVNVSQKVDRGHELAGLLHDASEAYLMDIPRPIKNNLIGYKEAEDKLMRMIAERYGFEYPLHKNVKQCDESALQYEWENIVLKTPGFWVPPGTSKAMFLNTFNVHYK